MKRITLMACFALLIASAQAQRKPTNQIGITLGWQNFQFLDKHASPLKYGTNSLFPSLGLYYSHQTDQSYYNIKVSGAKGTANALRFGAREYKTKWSSKDSFQYQVSSQFINANIEATYFRNIRSLSTDKTQYWVGGSLNESAYYADEVANFPWMVNTLDLSPAFQMQHTTYTKHSIGFKVDLAAIGLVTRSVYSLFPKSNKDKNVPAYLKQGTRLASVNKYQKVNLQFNYQFQMTKHFAVGAEYRLKWMHSTYPKHLRALDKHFDIKFAYTY